MSLSFAPSWGAPGDGNPQTGSRVPEFDGAPDSPHRRPYRPPRVRGAAEARRWRPNVGVIGAGRAGSALGAALRRAGFPVTAVSARSEASRARAAALLPGVPVTDPPAVARAAGLLVLAVADDALGWVVAELAAANALAERATVVHVSGCSGLDVLEPAISAGAAGVALHPAMTFTGTPADLDRIPGAFFGVTAGDGARRRGEEIVRALGGIAVPIDEQSRPLWHAGLAHGANHLVTLVSSAADVLRAAGVPDPGAVLRPLLTAALDNALDRGDAALTGPVARGDAGTVARHLSVLAGRSPAERGTYLALARATAARLPELTNPALVDVLADSVSAAGAGTAPAAGAMPAAMPAAVSSAVSSAVLSRVLSRVLSPDRAAARPEPAVNAAMAAGTLQMPLVVDSREGLTAALAGTAHPRAVVMTMGALHAGHAALVRAARRNAAHVTVTIFVNPLQFGPAEDLGRYPRTFDADLELCAREGADLVFAPTPEVVYPGGDPAVTVDPGPAGRLLEGASRPGHFAGVLTVVAKLLHLTRPDVTFFGEKDYQQLVLIRAMVRDLDFGVDVVGVPTVREGDGLAMSSRNRYLSPPERASARALSRSLAAGAAAAADGPAAVLSAARAVLDAEPGVRLDRLDLVDATTLQPVASGPARLLVAAYAGTTRLIDNIAVPLSRPDVPFASNVRASADVSVRKA